MKSPTTSTDKNRGPVRIAKQSGFTLIEILIVIGIIAVVAGAGVFIDFDSFRGYSFHSDRDILISALQHARAEAVSNICRGGDCENGGKKHGVKILTDKYVIFQGNDYNSRDVDYDAFLDASPATGRSGITEVVFAQLSGNASSISSSGDCATLPEPLCIILQGGTRSSVITINSEGQILWTN